MQKADYSRLLSLLVAMVSPDPITRTALVMAKRIRGGPQWGREESCLGALGLGVIQTHQGTGERRTQTLWPEV